MAYNARVLNVLIASPGDVREERRVVREVLAEWNVVNADNRNTVLMPIGWETHSSPELGGRPQQLINDRLLSRSDLLVGMFWSKLGTSTGRAPSGTVEEIQEHHAAGRPALLYFCKRAIPQNMIDADQFNAVADFKKWAQSRGLYDEYDDLEEFANKLRRHIPISLSDNEYLRREIDGAAISPEPIEALGSVTGANGIHVSSDAFSLLLSAAESNGHIYHGKSINDEVISAANRRFNLNDHRSTAQWLGRVEELERLDLVRPVNPDKSLYSVTAKGYDLIEARESV